MGDKKSSSKKLDRIYHFEHIPEQIHGLKGNFKINVLHVGDKYPRSVPRVKVFRNNLYGRETFSVLLNIDPDIEIRGHFPYCFTSWKTGTTAPAFSLRIN